MFSSMETTDHPVWVMKWSLSWGLYSPFRSFKDLDDDDSGKLDPNEVGPGRFCWAMWGCSGWNWVFNGFLVILRDFHPMFFADFSLLFSHINLPLNIVQTSISWLASTRVTQAMNLLTHFGCITSGGLGG